MIDVTFSLNGDPWSDKLSTYRVDYVYEYKTLVTTIDGTEYGRRRIRPTLVFSFIPLSEFDCARLYSALSNTYVTADFTDPNTGETHTGEFRVISSLSDIFGLNSVDGNRYYKVSTIQMRMRTVL